MRRWRVYKDSPVKGYQQYVVIGGCCITGFNLIQETVFQSHRQCLEYIDNNKTSLISLSHAMRPGLQIRHFWVAKSLFLTITFNQK